MVFRFDIAYVVIVAIVGVIVTVIDGCTAIWCRQFCSLRAIFVVQIGFKEFDGFGGAGSRGRRMNWANVALPLSGQIPNIWTGSY